MTLKAIFTLLIPALAILQIANADDCARQYDALRTCIRNQMQQDQNDTTANTNKRQRVQLDCQSCCKQSGCLDPFPQSREENVRQQCFSTANGQVRQAIQICVQSQATNFQLPGDDNEKDAYWNYLYLRTFAAMKNIGDNSRNPNRKNKGNWQRANPNQPPNNVCGNDDNKKASVSQCLKNKGTFNYTSAKSNWRRNSCRIKRQCNNVTQPCQQEWDNNYKPRTCDCVNTLAKNGTLKAIQDNYVKCLHSYNIQVQDDNNDDGRVVVGRFLTSWCPSGNASQSRYANQNDPCKRNRNNNNNNNNNGQGTNVQSQTYDDGTTVPQTADNPMAGFLGGNDLFSSLGSAGLGGGSPLSGGGLGGLFSGFPGAGGLLGGGGSPLTGGLGGSPLTGGLGGLGGGGGSSLLSGLGGGTNPLGALGGGSNLLGGLGGGSNILGGGLGGGPLQAFSSLGGGGGGGLTDLLGAGNVLGGMSGIGKKK